MSLLFHFVSFHRFSFLRFEKFVNLIFPAFFRSSHWSVCFVIGAETKVPFCCFVHRSSSIDAILIARRHFILLCVSIQHGTLAAFIFSMAVAVLLFMYSIHSASSISTVSTSSSESLTKETSLSWSPSVFVLLPSAVSSSESLWFAFSSSSFSSFLLVFVFFLYFLSLEDEAKHFPLNRSCHSFVFF